MCESPAKCGRLDRHRECIPVYAHTPTTIVAGVRVVLVVLTVFPAFFKDTCIWVRVGAALAITKGGGSL